MSLRFVYVVSEEFKNGSVEPIVVCDQLDDAIDAASSDGFELKSDLIT